MSPRPLLVRLGRAELWLPAGLVLVALLGGGLLQDPRLVALGERDRQAYGELPKWRARFDALSATCGVGLLTNRPRDYTPAGRWTLVGLGAAGAALYLAAARQVVGRLAGRALPGLPKILAALGVVLVLATAAVVVADRWSGAALGPERAAWLGLSAALALGFGASPVEAPALRWTLAAVSIVTALGWSVWLAVPLRRAGWRLRGLLTTVAVYPLLLVGAAGLMAWFEAPRAVSAAVADRDRTARAPPAARFSQWLSAAAAASGSGTALDALSDRRATEGTKLALAGVVTLGGLGGSLAGGIKLTAALSLILFISATCVRRGPPGDVVIGRPVLAAAGGLVAVLGLTLVVAVGLLAIESGIGSAYDIPPTVGDAFLDAASAVSGAGLTSGLVESLTSERLSSGIQQTVDEYQYGLAWLMAAMLLGRVVPLVVVGRLAGVLAGAAAPRWPVVI